ncbi:Fic family protein [Thiorhodospira sibirica]|uniref:Fic family protein n=1 Tax=Thiorhodospira sibirica TaxID=154347 RepID=UPI00022C5DED|nr:Fic family protein [Thiorhodospira sibirica]
MTAYHPPFQLTHRMTEAMTSIAELLGAWKAVNADALRPELRRGNRIRSIQASLAVEQNTLTLEQVTAVLEGRLVLGSPREIQEVRNAFAAYESMSQWQPDRAEDLLAAHGVMMAALVDDAGQWRRGGVGVMAGDEVIHVAPPASQVPRLMDDLLSWLARTEAHPLIASAAFHYEFEFIHPFSDGNGRMGRLWQSLILSRWQPVLAYLPVETVIKRRQQAYYDELAVADERADCSGFIQFILTAIQESLQEAISSDQPPKTLVKTLGKTPGKTPERILSLLAETPSLSIPDLAQHIGKSESAVERAIRKLKAAGRLARIGPDKGGHWQVLDRVGPKGGP